VKSIVILLVLVASAHYSFTPSWHIHVAYIGPDDMRETQVILTKPWSTREKCEDALKLIHFLNREGFHDENGQIYPMWGAECWVDGDLA
jgi:hypothetical protein